MLKNTTSWVWFHDARHYLNATLSTFGLEFWELMNTLLLGLECLPFMHGTKTESMELNSLINYFKQVISRCSFSSIQLLYYEGPQKES